MADQAARALKALEDLSTAVEEAERLEDFAAFAVGRVAEALDLESVSLDLYLEGSFARAATFGCEPDGAEYEKWRAEATRNLHTKRPYLDAHFKDPSVHAYAWPLRYKGNPIGALYTSDGDAMGDASLEAMVAMATAIGKCCSLMKLASQLEAQTTEFRALVEIGKAVNAQLDLNDLLLLLTNTALQLTRGDTASVGVTGGDGGVEIAAACGLHETRLKEEGPSGLEKVIGEVAHSGHPILVPDTESLEADALGEMARSRGIRSVLAVPLRHGDDIAAVLAVDVCEGPRRFTPEDLDLLTVMADQASGAMENARLYGDMQDLYVATIKSLAYTIEAKDKYTRGHSDRVTEYAVAIAERMGFSPDEISTLRFAGILHDIGKIAIAEEILNKPGKLSPVEREVVQTHPAESARIIRPIGFLKDVVPIVEHHHEWFDGTGYSDGLAGDSIPKGARVLSVADAFEAMTSDRPYHSALPWPNAIAELKRGAGTQFDPDVVVVFVGMILESLEMGQDA